MGAEIFWIDLEDLVIAVERARIITLNLAKLTKLLQGNAIARKCGQHLSDIGFGLIQLATLHEYPCLLKDSAHVCGIRFDNCVQNSCRFVILFQLDVRHGAIHQSHRAIFFVQLGRASKRIDCQRVLPLIEQRDGVIVPASPFRNRGLVVWIGKLRFIAADLHDVLSSGHRHDRIVDGLAKRVVAENAREAPIASASRQMKRATDVRWNMELISRHIRAPRIDLIVLGKDPRSPNVMLVIISAVGFDQIGFVIVRRFLEILSAEPRVSATALQTVGTKGYDGFSIALVTADPQ